MAEWTEGGDRDLNSISDRGKGKRGPPSLRVAVVVVIVVSALPPALLV